MSANDSTVRTADLALAVGLLTRLPVPVDADLAAARGARAAWAWPLAGLAVAGLAALTGTVALALGLPPLAVAGLVLGTQMMLTGALHEDGLADCADGFWGGHDVARRLEIMKDSRIGAYGTLALGVMLLVRGGALAALADAGPGALTAGLLAAAALSRAGMAALMHALPNARGGGLAARVGVPPRAAVLLGGGLALAVAVLAAGGPGLVAAAVAGGAVLAVGRIARAKIGGQTGDVLGAAQVMAETAALLTFCALP